MDRVGLHESPNTLIANLGVGKQQLVEIAKALAKKVKLLILDVSAVLAPIMRMLLLVAV